MPITLALFDMAATTVDDTINGRPLVLQSFEDSFNAVHVTVPWEVLNAQRGKDKMEVFRTLLASHGGLQGDALEQTAQRLLEHFTAQLLRNVARLESRQNNLSNLPSPSFAVSRTSHESWIGCYGEPPLHEMPGATTAFRFLKQRGVFIALGSGFPLDVTQAIARHFGWTTSGLVDYVTCGEAAGAGRPHPHMLHRALQAAGLLPPESPVHQVLPDFAYDQVLKVGDTVQDVAEGCNVGALTIAVASGTQSAKLLEEAGPAAVLPSVAELPDWLVTHGYVAHQPAA